MTSVADLLRDAARRLSAAGVETGRLDARLLLGTVIGRAVWPHESGAVTADQIDRFDALLARRLDREPVSRILGRREFWTLDLIVGPETLDPRPDSETLIEAAIAGFADRAPPSRVLDLGTGTGCLLLAALAVFPEARGLGVDVAAGAVETARSNAARNRLGDRAAFAVTDWADLTTEPADLVLSNPPYIEAGAVAGLAPEVARFDPMGALVGGADGLEAYRSLAAVLPRVLAPDGIAILELGAGQCRAVAALSEAAGFSVEDVRKDLGGIDRSLMLKWNDTGDHCLNQRHFCLE